MSEQKTYTVIELASLLEVPRTTVNDWLSRYAKYIDFQNVGRRRVYPESALAVLKDIAKLRSEGKSFPAIESELEKTHAVRAEEIPESAGKTEDEENGGKDPAEKNGDSALVAKQDSDEIGRMIGESFRDMAGRMQELEKRAESSERKLLFGYAVIFLLLLALASGLYLLFRTARAEGERSQQTNQNIQTLSAQTVSLAGSTEEVRKGIRELEQGLDRQKKEFDEAVRNMKDSKEAEVALLKEKFAAERAALLKDLDNMSKDKDQIIRDLQKKLKEQEKTEKPQIAQPAQTGKK